MNIFLRCFVSIAITLTTANAVASPNNKGMELQTNAFKDKMVIPTLYTCDGKDISPDFRWSNAPANTESFAIILSDPDAPGGTFYHWLLYNIPKSTRALSAGSSTPPGARCGINDFNKSDYSGPCPPKGSLHHYVFTLYAVDQTLKVSKDATPHEILKSLDGHIISQTELTGAFTRWVK